VNCECNAHSCGKWITLVASKRCRLFFMGDDNKVFMTKRDDDEVFMTKRDDDEVFMTRDDDEVFMTRETTTKCL